MPLLWLSTAFLLGLLLAAWQAWPWWVWAGLAGAALLSGLVESRLGPKPGWSRFNRLPLGAVLAVLCLGGLRYSLAQPTWTERDLAWYNERGPARLIGIISAPPERRNNDVRARVAVQQITPLDPDRPRRPVQVHGTLLAILSLPGDWRYGDRVELVGQPVTPPEFASFSYKDYLARQGIHTYLPYSRAERLERDAGSPLLAVLFRLRQRAYQFILAALPQPEGALLAGILLGIEEDLPDTVQESFRQTGTAHIVAISGFNIAIVAGLFSMLFSRLFSRWLPRLWLPPLVIVTIALYTLLVGAQASVVRAAIMGSFGLIGEHIGRRQSGVNSLAFCAALMGIANPFILWDVGFQLSFSATLGLILFADPLQQGFIRLAERRLPSDAARRLAGPIGEYFLFTLAAQLTTLPVVIYHFRRVSLSAVLANPLILPPQPLVMILGGIAVLTGLLFPMAGKLLALLTWPLLAYTIRAADLLAGLPGGGISTGNEGLWLAAMAYLALIGFATLRKPTANASLPGKFAWDAVWNWLVSPFLLAVLALGAGLAWRAVLSRPDGRLHLILLQQESGLAALVQTPSGHWLLVNGGKDTNLLANALGRRLPPFEHRLDFWIITSDQKDDLSALPALLERYPPSQVLWMENENPSSAMKQLADSLSQAGIRRESLLPGQVLDLGNGAVLQVGSDPRADESPEEIRPVLMLEWGNFQARLEQSGEGLMVTTLAGLPPPLRAGEWIELQTDGAQLWVTQGK